MDLQPIWRTNGPCWFGFDDEVLVAAELIHRVGRRRGPILVSGRPSLAHSDY
jgi:hypothetical protein